MKTLIVETTGRFQLRDPLTNTLISHEGSTEVPFSSFIEQRMNLGQLREVEGPEGTGVVCGEFNAPNKQGGYDGFDVFAYYSRDRWMTGLVYGKVMINGQLVDTADLHNRTSHIGRTLSRSDDTADLDKQAAAMHAATEMLHGCPSASGSGS